MKDNKIDVLDHGFVRLVSYMQPVPIEEHHAHGAGPDNDFNPKVETIMVRDPAWSGDLEIIRNARVSYNADWRTGDDADKDAKLINRMMTGKHSSPFEAMVFTFEVQAPIFVFRQWHRHRTWSYNEVSARYAEVPEVFYIPEHGNVGVQHKTDKQMRDTRSESGCEVDFIANLSEHSREAFKQYKRALERGVPRELARAFLPVNTYSRMFCTVDLHNLMHFLRLRLDVHAQHEITVYAEAMLELVKPICPVAVEAFRRDMQS